MSVNSFNASNPPLTTKGDLFTFSTIPTRIAVGTNDQVLTADSSTATGLKWAAVAGGGMTVIASGSLTGTQVNLTSIPATYKNLRLVVRNFIPATDGDVLALRLQNDSNTRYRTVATSSSPNNAQTFNSGSFVVNASQDDTVSQSSIIIDFEDYTNTLTWKIASIIAINNNQTTSTNFNSFTGYGLYNQTTAISQINLFNAAAGSFNGGTYILYGVS